MNNISDAGKKKKQSAGRGRKCLLFYMKVVRGGLAKKVTSEQKPKGSKECRRLFQEE